MTIKEKVVENKAEEITEVPQNPEENKETVDSVATDITEPEKPKEPEEVKTEEATKTEEAKKEDDSSNLKVEISKLQDELVQTKNNSREMLDQANTRLKEQKNLVSEYEGILNEIIDTKLKDIPENLKELVPANVSLKEKINWITKAEKSGIFTKPQQANPQIEIGKPLNPSTTNKQQTDTSKMSASAIMAMAYGNSQTKKKK